MSDAAGLATRTTWVVMTTNPRPPPLYCGVEREAASAALALWQPELGEHDRAPALRIAHGMAGGAGRTLLITDTRGRVPAGQRAAGVGKVLENVGFAGVSFTRESGGHTWRALVKNHAPSPQSRTWRIESGGVQLAEQSVSLAPGAPTEISARLSEDANEATVCPSCARRPSRSSCGWTATMRRLTISGNSRATWRERCS
jgi:hypothetical protein